MLTWPYPLQLVGPVDEDGTDVRAAVTVGAPRDGSVEAAPAPMSTTEVGR